jgi:hypothetical protein
VFGLGITGRIYSVRILGFLVLALCFALSIEVIGSTSDSKAILLLRAPHVGESVFDECFAYVKANVGDQVRRDRTLLPVGALSPEQSLKVFSGMRTPDDALVVVLGAARGSEIPAVVYSERLGSAVVNVCSSSHGDKQSEMAQVAVFERAVLYAIGRLVGMPSCLNPHCALSEYKHIQKGVNPGRNYCPNCCDRVAAGLRAVGVQERVNTRAKTAPSE